MSRSFNPTTGADSITFSVGNAPPDQGPITIAVLAKSLANTFTGYLVNGRATGTVWGALTSNNPDERLFAENDFGNGVASVVNGSWRWYVITKASGSVQPRMHIWDLSSAWTHANNTANVGDGAGPITSLIVGGNGTGSQGWRGSIAVVAAWDSALSDAAIEAAMTLHASDVFAASPKWMIRLNQASIATSVSDDTAGGGNQSAISGTTVDADDPPGFNYALTSSQTVAPTGLAISTALGTPTVSQALTVTPSGLAVPVAVGAPAVTQTLTVAPTGLAVPVALGAPSVSMLAGTVALSGLAIPVVVGTPTVTGQPYNALQVGSWWGLESILDASRSQIQYWNTKQPIACPNDGEPLRRSVDGLLYCPFDNWRPDGQNIRRGIVARDWGQLNAIRQAARADTAINQLILSCPNDGEPLSIGANGVQFCRYDGWMPPDQPA